MTTDNDILENSELPKGLLSWYPFKAGSSLLCTGNVSSSLKVLFGERSLHVSEDISEGCFDYIFMAPGSGYSVKELADCLKTDGHFLMAADNRFGLKYMCGAVDSDVTKPFAGINEHAKGLPNGRLYDRKSLSDLLDRCFAKHKFYYPVADWRLPQLIFSDDYLPQTDLNERAFFYYQQTDTLIADQAALWRDVIANQSFAFHANSFLVECVKNTAAELCRVIHATVSTERGRANAYAVKTMADGTVEKTALYPQGREGLKKSCEAVTELDARGIRTVKHSYKDGTITMPFVRAPLMSEYIRGLFDAEKADEIRALADQYHDIIMRSSDTVPDDKNALPAGTDRGLDFGPIMKHCFMELITLNSFYSDGGPVFFDQEFVRENYPAKYALYRLIEYIYCINPKAEAVVPKKYFKDRYGIADELWAVFQDEENRFQAGIHNTRQYAGFFSGIGVDRQRILKNEYILMGESKDYISSAALQAEIAAKPHEKKYHTGYLQGSFDLFHVGHLNMIKRAAALCDYLIVGVVSDEIQKETKGELPFIPYEERAAVVAAVKGVDRVVKVSRAIFDKKDAAQVLHFDVSFAGSDHAAEAEELKKQFAPFGAAVEIFPYTQSTNSTKIRGLINGKSNAPKAYEPTEKMKKIWQVELSILDEIDKICKKHGLQYFLVHGTLLGAVRHKGFIPWDDDLDISMLRKDYDKFLKYAAKELPVHLGLCLPGRNGTSFNGATRIRDAGTSAIEPRDLDHEGNLGIWVDILPLDYCPESDEEFSEKTGKLKDIYCMMQAKYYPDEMKEDRKISASEFREYRRRAKSFKADTLADMMDEAMHLYSSKKTDTLACFTNYRVIRRLSADDFSEAAYLEFEGRQVPVPVLSEHYLFATMGKDYMKLPPISEQVPHHNGIYDPDRPYTEYQKLLNDTFKGIRGRKIILFGAGLMFEDYMKKYGDKYRPEFIADNDESKWDTCRLGIDIKRPEAILEVPEDKRRLIICSFYYREISAQLDAMGISDYHVYVQHPEWVVDTDTKS